MEGKVPLTKMYTKAAARMTEGLKWEQTGTVKVWIATETAPDQADIPIGDFVAVNGEVLYGEDVQGASGSEAGVVHMYLTNPRGEMIQEAAWGSGIHAFIDPEE